MSQPYQPSQQPPKPLTRSMTNKMIAGVCGGLANYFNVDPVLMRVIFVLLVLIGIFPGVLAYLVCWVVIPPEF